MRSSNHSMSFTDVLRKDAEEEIEKMQTLHLPNISVPRCQSVLFDTPLKCWFSLDADLMDVSQQDEFFVVHGRMSVIWQDNTKHNFTNLFDDDQLKFFKNKGCIRYTDLAVDIRKRLPFYNETFIINAVDMNIKTSHLGLWDHETSDQYVWEYYIDFVASINERFELEDFPFDAQFLNIHIAYKTLDYFFVSECPRYILNDASARYKMFDTDKAIKLSMKDSLQDSWIMYEPWINFNVQCNQKSARGLIRFRVLRTPHFVLTNRILPLFLVVSCGFAGLSMSMDEYLDNKIEYIQFVTTLLLTLSAFQYTLSLGLPQTPQITRIDVYILYGYFILFAFVVEISIISTINDESAAETLHYLLQFLMMIVWLYKSLQFGYWYVRLKNNEIDWQRLSDEEMSHLNTNKLKVQKGRHSGSAVMPL